MFLVTVHKSGILSLLRRVVEQNANFLEGVCEKKHRTYVCGSEKMSYKGSLRYNNNPEPRKSQLLGTYNLSHNETVHIISLLESPFSSLRCSLFSSISIHFKYQYIF